MTINAGDLTRKRCAPCEGGVNPFDAAQVQEHLRAVPQWRLTEDGKRIRREWRVKDFVSALDFFQRVGNLAEAEDHHPDHLSAANASAGEEAEEARGPVIAAWRF